MRTSVAGTATASTAAAEELLHDTERAIAELRAALRDGEPCDALLRSAVHARTRLNAALWAVADVAVDSCDATHGRAAARRAWEAVIERSTC